MALKIHFLQKSADKNYKFIFYLGGFFAPLEFRKKSGYTGFRFRSIGYANAPRPSYPCRCKLAGG
ncbi:hypothetical protein [Treponema pectinovorum]|uniref:hypothetical protein n=1 Tax=Treponema pectinovorum TaxID=164 RepID=UPI0011C8AF6C|nr:hypothetical protein [Treponema pectinovorum]